MTTCRLWHRFGAEWHRPGAKWHRLGADWQRSGANRDIAFKEHHEEETT